MPLNELTLAELTALMHRIATIVSAGNALQAGGLGPVFDLTPGAPITIYTNAVMPATDEGVKEPVDPPPALGEVVGGGPVADEPKRKSVVELWTADEDATLLDAMVELMVGAGMARKPAATKAAERLPGRSADGCIYRIHTKLKEPLAARLTAAASLQAETETPEIPEVTKVDPDQRDAAAGGHSLAAVQSEPQKPAVSWAADPITAHLMALPESGGWTLDRDATLMELSIAGWQPNEIALEVGMRADQIKARFDALTGLYLDANRKPVRRFPREDVMAALARLSVAA